MQLGKHLLARTLLVAPGIATSNRCIAPSSKDATSSSWTLQNHPNQVAEFLIRAFTGLSGIQGVGGELFPQQPFKNIKDTHDSL